MARGKNKNLDFEINLLPIISILAVCLAMLLLTTVWVRVAAFNANQALGTEETAANKNPSSLWVSFQNDGTIEVIAKDVKNLPKYLLSFRTSDSSDARKISNIDYHIQRIKKAHPDLNTALVLPSADAKYELIVAVMDKLKKNQIKDIGIAPL